MKDSLQKGAIAFASLTLFDLIHPPGSPADDRWIHIAEIPLVSRDLPVRMLIPFAQNDIELTLGKRRIDQSQWDAMKGQVPGRIPRIFPTIRHRHHPFIKEMAPI